MTSMSSSVLSKNTLRENSYDRDVRNSIKLIPVEKSILNSSGSSDDMKKQYKEFVKIFLKVKFEKIHSTHHGQQIPEKVLFSKCISDDIPQKEWGDFILKELKQPNKYSKYIKMNLTKRNFRSLPQKYNKILIC